MKASIVHPDVQNLVIKNNQDKIIAKSTLYVNRKQGYAIFNNVEVKDDINDEDRKKIYGKYILAVNCFVEQYNKENPDKQLKQVNVGVGRNDLIDFIEEDFNYAKIPLKAINYRDYSRNGEGYNGDANVLQSVLWRNK